MIPKDYPVQPLKAGQKAKHKATCGTCNRSWDDGLSTSMTPAPSGRCPFEAFHREDRPKKKASKGKKEFIAYLKTTLIPDLRESGRDFTADDFETCIRYMEG